MHTRSTDDNTWVALRYCLCDRPDLLLHQQQLLPTPDITHRLTALAFYFIVFYLLDYFLP